MNIQNQALKCRTLVVKIASRCNLNCSYCYMYNLGDQSYQQQPKLMSEQTVDLLMQRVREHALQHHIDEFTFVLHGGEPLLAPKSFFRKIVAKAKQILLPDIRPVFQVQTNGTLLNREWCEIFNDLNIEVGISLDGTQQVHDRFRVDHAGRGSYEAVLKGLKSARQYLRADLGVLSVIDVQADPIQVYRHLQKLGFDSMDFLLPETTHDKVQPSVPGTATPYADWLIPLFDIWFQEQQQIQIRFFFYILHGLLGGSFSADNLGELNNEVLVIETDGGIEAVDALKACGHAFTKAGANVRSHSFDQAMATPLASLYHMSHQKLTCRCLACPVREICGGGYLPHRYSQKNGFDNPSVYCHDLLKLITHIQNKVVSQLPTQFLETTGMKALSFEQAMEHIQQQLKTVAAPAYTEELVYFKDYQHV